MSRHVRPLLVVAMLAILGMVPLSAQAPGDSLPAGVTSVIVERGKVVFTGPGICFACHGMDASGGTGPNLSDTTWIHSRGEFEKIVAVITSGVAAKDSKSGVIMPPRGGSAINDDDLRAVAAYVWSLSHRR